MVATDPIAALIENHPDLDADELLNAMDATSANLAKLEKVWERAAPLLLTGPSLVTSTEYEDLQRTWVELLQGIPPIGGVVDQQFAGCVRALSPPPRTWRA